MDQESVVLGMKTANKELFPPHISILKHLWMSTVMSMMTQLHKHFIWESYWICRWMCINLIPCDVSGAHVVLHPPLIKIFWSVAIQKFLRRLLCCLIPQFLPDSSDALAPAILWTSISQMVRHTTRMIFWWAVFISDLGREGAKQTNSVASISVVAWEWKGGVNLKPLYGKRNKQGYYNIPLWWMHTLHFENYFEIQEQMLYKKMQTLCFLHWRLCWFIWGIYIM